MQQPFCLEQAILVADLAAKTTDFFPPFTNFLVSGGTETAVLDEFSA